VSTCTWHGCPAEALHQELDRDGKPWAHLCQKHHEMLDRACAQGDAKRLMAAWVLAQPQEQITEAVTQAFVPFAEAVKKLATCRTERGRRLLALRQRIVASGTELLTLEEINRERA